MKIIKLHKHFFIAIVISFLTYVIFFGQFLTPSHYFWGYDGRQTDAQTRHIPARTYLYDKIVNEHSFPFWTEKMYSGFPIYADFENAYLHPANVASILVFGPQTSYKVLHVLEYLIGSLSLFFLLKRKGIGLLGYAAANIIFYFNTFAINHQIHFNIIMAFYLFPTAFLLADLFIEKRQLRYIFLQSLVVANAVLWGHMQFAVILFMGVFVYMAVFSFKKMRFSTFFFYFTAIAFFVTIETIPQIIPTYELFSESSRNSGLDYLKGSLSPRMAIFSFAPYLLGGYKQFLSSNVSKEFAYTEIYNYFGISSVILSALALLILKKSREVILALVFIWIFLIFGFMGHNRIFPDNMPLITLFREWGRTAVFSSFGIAILTGIFVEKLSEASYKSIRMGILFILSPLVYIWILIKMEGEKTNKKIDFYTSFNYIKTYPYFSMLVTITLVLICILLLFIIVKKWYPQFSAKILIPVQSALIIIVFFDLIYFSQDVLAYRLQDISNYKIASIPKELENKRAIIKTSNAWGMESLYYANWSPLGQSQLKEKNYVRFYDKLGISLNGVPSSHIRLPENYQNLKETGIVAIADDKGITYLNDSKLDLIKNNLDGHYVEKKEGRIVMQINNPADTIINTYLKYNPNWKIKVDGRQTQIMKNGIFFDFPLSQGKHLVEIYYYPKPFYVAVAISLISGIITGLLLYAFRKNIKNLMLK